MPNVENIQKFDPSYELDHEIIPYAQFDRVVVESLAVKNPDAFAVWAFLACKPKDWVINHQYIQNTFGWGKNKVKDVFKYLSDWLLIIKEQKRDNCNRFCQGTLKLRNGTEYKEILNKQDVNIDNSIPEEKLSTEKSRSPVFRVPELRAPGKQATTNKDIFTNKIINKKKATQKFKKPYFKNPASIVNLAGVESQTTTYQPEPYVRPQKNIKTESCIDGAFECLGIKRTANVKGK